MKKTLHFLALILLVCSCKSPEQNFLSLCEEIIKERLRSPSGYQLIKFDLFTEELALDQYRDITRAHGINGWQRDNLTYLEKNNIVPTVTTVIVKYDAPNAFGTLIRDTDSCKYISQGKLEKDIFKHNIIFGGKTHKERLIEKIKNIAD